MNCRMPQNDPRRLSREQNADVWAYLLIFHMFPAGKSELAHDIALLKQIRTEATKPDRHNDKWALAPVCDVGSTARSK